MKICCIILIFIFLLITSINSQDRHYWDQAVGGKTALLGGIAVGGVRDYSATFYNPGALSFLSKNNLSFSFSAYGIKDFRFINGGGPGIDSRYTRVSLYPSSLAGSLPFLGDSLNRFSYMIYGNSYSYVRVTERYEGYKDVIPTRPPSLPGFKDAFEGEEFVINQGKFDVLLQEVTVCLGYSKRISDNIGIGFTVLGAYRDQTKVRYETYAALDTTYQRSATTDTYIDIDYWAVRFSGKFGISAEWENLKLGATITTPSLPLKLASGATDGTSFTSNNVFVLIDSVSNETIPIDILASDRQEGLSSSYKTPLSISAGIEYQLTELSKIHFMCELFAPLSTYVVIQPESDNFIRNLPSGTRPIDSAEFLKVYDSMKSVFNFGLAYEQKLSNEFAGYVAARTDFSNANFDKIDGLFIGITDIDIYHFTAGTSYSTEDTFLALGIEYSYGANSDFTQIFNFPTEAIQPGDVLIGTQRGTCKTIYNNFNVFFGVTQLL
ncbi:MAG: hypothetical protein OQJ93_10520 [Ignavibacteriaceae bacterium]|jgi:hypothetical protein|nr:hypothetical protein [Ignavibacteriaceae bacterium]MCW8816433.1 hypothetical protein [Ignavibacteriaceae bacterium]MCW8822844.1 hypothetical protein [Ignavibacteriaceae bacterium]MCW9097812.1 hypothetical protein [Ignavibacteriaceae bacterium]